MRRVVPTACVCVAPLLVGGIGQHHFDGTSFKPRKLPENATAERHTTTPVLPLRFTSGTSVHRMQCGASVAPILFGDRVHAVLARFSFFISYNVTQQRPNETFLIQQDLM